MRFTGAIACGYVAFDCFGKATGEVSQTLFAAPHTWVWFIFAFMWGASCLEFIFTGKLK
jgi:hypothetical protein